MGRCGRIENTTVCDTFPPESILMAVGRPERRQNGHATWRDIRVREETHNMTRAPEPRKARDAQQEEACSNSVVSRLQRLFIRIKYVSNTYVAAHIDTERGVREDRAYREGNRRARNEAQKRRGQGASVRTTFGRRRLRNRACGDSCHTVRAHSVRARVWHMRKTDHESSCMRDLRAKQPRKVDTPVERCTPSRM